MMSLKENDDDTTYINDMIYLSSYLIYIMSYKYNEDQKAYAWKRYRKNNK